MAVDQRELAVERERAAVEQELVIGRQRGGVGRLDAAHEKERVAHGGERGQALAAGREEDAPAGGGQQRGGLVERRDLVPVDRRIARERRALEAQQRRARLRAGPRRRPRHALGERMRGVDNRADALVAQVRRQPVRPAEAADAHLAGRQAGVGDPPGQRRNSPNTRDFVECRGQRARLAGPAEDEHRPHALRPSPAHEAAAAHRHRRRRPGVRHAAGDPGAQRGRCVLRHGEERGEG